MHDVLVGVVEETACSVAIRCRKNDIQPHVEGLPRVSHDDCVAVQAVQLLDALEAVI